MQQAGSLRSACLLCLLIFFCLSLNQRVRSGSIPLRALFCASIVFFCRLSDQGRQIPLKEGRNRLVREEAEERHKGLSARPDRDPDRDFSFLRRRG